MEDKEVSIIIPVYNAEKYLKRCVEGLFKQTYTNWICFLINDGSTDNSGKLCDELSLTDSRIKVLHQSENRGVSAARNLGLDSATGDYVCFIDADDQIPVDSLEKRVAAMEESGLLVSGYEKLEGESRILKDIAEAESFSNLDFIPYIFRNRPYGYQGYLWNKLFSLPLITKNCIAFDVDIAYNEDRLFLIKYLLTCGTVKLVPGCVYSYMVNTDSVMGSKKYSEKLKTDVAAYERIEQLLKENGKVCMDDFYVSFIKRCLFVCNFAKKCRHKDWKFYKKISLKLSLEVLLKKSSIKKVYRLKLLVKSIIA